VARAGPLCSVHVADTEPFARSDVGAGAAQLLGGESAALGVRGHAANAMRLRIEAWARGRALAVIDSCVLHDVDRVAVRVPIYAITDATALVSATAIAPVNATVTVEPSAWLDRLRRAGVGTGDAAFDRRWTTRAPDAATAARIVDEDVREALRDVSGWCRATYDGGRIEVRLDAERMCGARLLEGAAVAAALARTRIATGAYR
jgi:hypothetical protein